MDPVLARTKTLYADNYQQYRRACLDGSLTVGSCFLRKRLREQSGLSVSHNSNQPSYIANIVVSDHPYHPIRASWLISALVDLQQQLLPLIRYQGIRRTALLARPLIFSTAPNPAQSNDLQTPKIAKTLPLDWYKDIQPTILKQLQDLPKLRIDLHVPKSIDI